jgi:hypothetical protein
VNDACSNANLANYLAGNIPTCACLHAVQAMVMVSHQDAVTAR